ncbi:MAG TPA: hypothetical protein VLE27_05995, partial [Thermoanaerobaculia bacterium]|nr:hypothetical protein [Thermoanaerobaculia bacterium]
MHTSLGSPTDVALQYLVLQQNNLQTSFEYSFLPRKPGDLLLGRLDTGRPLDRHEVMSELSDFYKRYMAWAKEEAESYKLQEVEEPDELVIITKARFSDCYYLTGQDRCSVIALGNWDSMMAPPSLVECILTLLVKIGVAAACGEHRPRSHHETKGCLFDFTSSLSDARYKTLAGYMCASCSEVIRSVHSEQLALDSAALLSKEWLGNPKKPSHAASMAQKLGYPLFRTRGFTPSFKERIRGFFEEESAKAIVEILSAIVIAALLLWLGLKDEAPSQAVPVEGRSTPAA